MSNKISIPLLSPVRWVVKDLSIESGVQPSFDAALFENQILSFQEKKRYFQKWQKSDTIATPITSNVAPSAVVLVDCTGATVKAGTISTVASGYITAPDVQYLFTIALSDVAEGFYWLKATFGSTVLLSEPLEVATTHKNTILFNYGNDINEYGIIFRTGKTFNFRCEAVLQDFQPGSNEVVFEDQPANVVRLSSFVFRSFKLIIGNAHGVPDWIADKINRIFSCDTVLLNGKQFVRPEGSKMDRNGDRSYPMSGWTFDVREAKARDSEVIEAGIPVERQISVIYDLETTGFGDLDTPPFGGNINIENIE